MIQDLKSEMKELRKASVRYKKDLISPVHITSTAYDSDSFEAEMADIIIRLMSFCERFHIDLPLAILEKMDYNETREN